ncbi:MAG: adenosylcobyric acid synthase [Lactobacillales bacterium]|jgi:CobQ-like glutamine amidotransferase family enzyme|nr:adenosylcobyric acid synthase [Lactobacillales bacterium]
MSKYELNLCHLYGNLLNTYGDQGNVLVLKHIAKKNGIDLNVEIISIHEPFEPGKYDLVFFGGGQDFEQTVVAEDLPTKASGITQYIETGGVMLAICGGYQFLGHHYEGAQGEKIKGISAIDFHTESQVNNRFIGDTKMTSEFGGEMFGFENHNGRTFLGEGVCPLGTLTMGKGNNGEDGGEGVHYKNTFGSYFHGPILARNAKFAAELLKLAISNKYGETIEIVE